MDAVEQHAGALIKRGKEQEPELDLLSDWVKILGKLH